MPFANPPLTITLAFLTGVAVGMTAVKTFEKLSQSCSGVSKLDQARGRLWAMVAETFTGILILAGDQLDLYELLYNTGAITPKALAEQTGWNERWLLEWLSQSAAAGICSYAEETNEFQLKQEYAQLLRDPDKSKESLVGLFTISHAMASRASAVASAIRTGIGVDYDFGDDVLAGMDRTNRNYFRYYFVDDVIRKVRMPSTGQPLIKLLQEGIAVADIGCGFGASTIAMAQQFPKSCFYAYELSPRSIVEITKRVNAMKLKNIVVCDVSKRSLADGPDDPHRSFTFVYSHDLLHDLTHPRKLIHDVKKVLSAHGGWIIVDIRCGVSTAENLCMPWAKIMLGYSCLLCLASATAEQNGEGLGTMGFNKELARQWMNQAGFEHCIPFTIPSLPENQAFLVA